MTLVIDGPQDLLGRLGDHLGHSPWLTVDAGRVSQFREATGEVPGTLGVARSHDAVQPYLLLALSNFFLPQIVEIRGFSAGVNTGTEAIHFVQPVPIGSRVRAGARLTSITETSAGTGYDTTTEIEIECDGVNAPVCTITARSRWLI